LLYCERIETTLRHENQHLSKELEDAQLDLEDARRSRREMQQQLNITNQRLGQFNMDNENLKVGPDTLDPFQPSANKHRTATPT
jgi:chromosome segregation ATPase